MAILQGLSATATTLYAAWKGETGDDRLFCSAFDGTSWDAPQTIPGNSSVGPSLAAPPDGTTLYAAWKGEHDDHRLFYATFDGTSWDAQKTIPGNSSVGPTLAALRDGTLYAAWKGEEADQRLFYASFDGSAWSAQQQIPGGRSCVGPWLGTFDNGLCAAWRGPVSDEKLYFASFDGSTWSGPTPIPGVLSSVGPSLAQLGGTLYALWKGEDTDEALYYASFDGATWTGQRLIPEMTSSVGASFAAFGGELYAVWKGAGTDQSLSYASFYGSGLADFWTTQGTLPGNTGQDMAPPPGAGLGSSSNYILASGGSAITDLVVSIAVTDPLAGSIGLAFQLNAYSATGARLAWQQYCLSFQTPDGSPGSTAPGVLYAYVQNWDLAAAQVIVDNGNPEVLQIPDSTIPAGSKLSITLTSSRSPQDDSIDSGSFAVEIPGAHAASIPIALRQVPGVTQAELAPITASQVDLVGPINGLATFLSSGRGTITYTASTALTALSSPPTASIQEFEPTGETANSIYGPLPLGASTALTQWFSADITAPQ